MELETFKKLINQLAKDYPQLERQDPREVSHWYEWFKGVDDKLAMPFYNHYIENYDTRPTTPKLIKTLKTLGAYKRIGRNQDRETKKQRKYQVSEEDCNANLLSGLVPAYRDGDFHKWCKKEECVEFRGTWYMQIDYCCLILGAKRVNEMLRSELLLSNQNDILKARTKRIDEKSNWHSTKNSAFSQSYRDVLAQIVNFAKQDDKAGIIYEQSY